MKVVEKEVVRPDPVLWFPGGDADCGGSAGGNADIFGSYSIFVDTRSLNVILTYDSVTIVVIFS